MLRDMHSYIRRPHAATQVALTARQVAAAYNFPMAQASGQGYIAGIVELGGGFDPAQVNAFLQSQGLPAINLTSVNVGRGSNRSDGPDGADGEVQLDIVVAGSIATSANFRVYFGGNSDADFLAALKQALAECHGVSVSWGQAESQWVSASMNAFEAVIKEARGRGVPTFVASGDSGSTDSTSTNTVDFPSSSPSAIGCGGTTLTFFADGAGATETVWNDNPTQSATGGGVSRHFPGRDVPDIAGNADPDTGYKVGIDGTTGVVGGTSAVAPLMLALHALVWELSAGRPFDFLNLIVTNPQACFDVTSGDNGGFRAGPGRDQTTGFGVPDGVKLLAALTGGIAPPVPPGPPVVTPPVVPPPVVTPPADPLSTFPLAAVQLWELHKHNYTLAERNAADAVAAWARSVGLAL